eukprot:2921703-Heterocapsa_arctica.AAC.1
MVSANSLNAGASPRVTGESARTSSETEATNAASVMEAANDVHLRSWRTCQINNVILTANVAAEWASEAQ